LAILGPLNSTKIDILSNYENLELGKQNLVVRFLKQLVLNYRKQSSLHLVHKKPDSDLEPDPKPS
jgi:hypothetical protein